MNTAWIEESFLSPPAIKLAKQLISLVNSAEVYMNYHQNKFYGGDRVSGLWPEISESKRVLNEIKDGFTNGSYPVED